MNFQNICKLFWRALWIALIAIILFPVASFYSRSILIAVGSLLWGGGVALFWKSKWVRFGFLAIGIIVGVFLLLPGRSPSGHGLRQAYVQALQRYEGCRYVWGGEGCLGIDCSGLIRRGLIDASLCQGLNTLNPRLIRESLDLWWHDCTARELRNGYRNKSHVLFRADTINTLDHSRILPGDLAVTADGIHVLAYLGDQFWIEADPSIMKVVRVRAPDSELEWFCEPVDIVCWRPLETF